MGVVISVPLGRPKGLNAPLGAAKELSVGVVISVPPGRPKGLNAPSGGSEGTERGGIHLIAIQ